MFMINKPFIWRLNRTGVPWSKGHKETFFPISPISSPVNPILLKQHILFMQ